MVAVDTHHPVVMSDPLLLERTDEDFLTHVLDELSATGLPANGDARVASTRDSQHVLKLQQPVHRTFYVAVFDVACDTYGRPRLDPERIDSAGLVVRRVREDAREGWRQGGKTVKGWLGFSAASDSELDPDAARRPPALSAGHPDIDRQLASQFGVNVLSETFTPLFVASPAVCEAVGRTILYGLLPLASSEQSQAPAAPAQFDADAVEEIRQDLPRLFLASGSRYIPLQGQAVSASDAANPSMAEFVNMLRQLGVEYDAFGTTPEAQQLFAELNTLKVDFPSQKQRPVGDWLRDATRRFVQGDTSVQVEMPVDRWPEIDAAREKRVLGCVVAALGARLRLLVPHEGRYDDLTRQYVARGFVRVKDESDCPPFLVWSAYTEPFRITPWYDPGNAPPVKIILPDASDKNFLKNIKPNVTFVVPPGLFNNLKNPPSKWLQSQVGPDNSLGLNWICSFSIPIITLCAFIVLYIFLTLFDLIFQWLIWVKICIPFPVRTPRPPST
jgi:hypothetical protein